MSEQKRNKTEVGIGLFPHFKMVVTYPVAFGNRLSVTAGIPIHNTSKVLLKSFKNLKYSTIKKTFQMKCITGVLVYFLFNAHIFYLVFVKHFNISYHA